MSGGNNQKLKKEHLKEDEINVDELTTQINNISREAQ